ncbi:MAG: hypothetical protein IH957_13175 [Chloroflexi bacterium]|nr:hypothetical protein [Chloroflexota bacterium]
MSKTASTSTTWGFPEIFREPEWREQWSRIKDGIKDRLSKPGASSNDIAVRAPLLVDAWEECGEIRKGIEDFSESDEERRGLGWAIINLESFKVDTALYERLAKLAYLRATGFYFQSRQSEIEGIQGFFNAWWSDDAKTKGMAEDVLALRRKTDDLSVALSHRELLALTSRPRRTAAKERLRRLLAEVETVSGKLRVKLDEPFD